MRMSVPNVVLIIVLVLVNVWAFRAITRFRTRGKRLPGWMSRSRKNERPTAAPAPAPVIAQVAAVEQAEEPIAVAIHVSGVAPGRAGTAALEQQLRRLSGVTSAYVSSVTGLTYVDYLASKLKADDVVQAIRSGGYEVGDESLHFDWRHRRVAAVDILSGGAIAGA